MEAQRPMQIVPVDQLVGKTLGDYHIERLLGQGELSAVYKAQHGAQSVMLMACIIPETFSVQARQRFSARFSQEGSALVKLRHATILPTYDVGEQFGYPYLVTPFMKGRSLAHVLKQQGHFTPEQTLGVLKHIAAGLDYAHSQGVLHGTIHLPNILVGSGEAIRIAGFGLMRMLEMYGIEQSPYGHLFSIAGTFLGVPEYVAPEMVQDVPVDPRADVYALGILLFELLSGTHPFTGTDPLEIAKKRLQQPVPSLHELHPEVPAALDLVLYQTLEPDPGERFQSAGEVASAFERALKLVGAAAKAPATLNQQNTTQDPQVTLPPTVNWFDEAIISSRKQPLLPSATTTNQFDGASAIDPFAWWLASSATGEAHMPATFPARTTPRLAGSTPGVRRQPVNKQRRQVVALLATGGVLGAFGLGAISLARMAQSMKSLQTANVQPAASTQQHVDSTPTPTQGASKSMHRTHKPASTTSTPHATPTAHATSTPTATPKPTPTTVVQIKPTPTPVPQHSGTVIGHTNQATNSAQDFTNPADGNASMLIHLPDGRFVACERACTHAGVPVDYDAGSHTLVCPAHGATFDPSNGFSVTQGPANSPLPGVSINVNADGTISVK